VPCDSAPNQSINLGHKIQSAQSTTVGKLNRRAGNGQNTEYKTRGRSRKAYLRTSYAGLTWRPRCHGNSRRPEALRPSLSEDLPFSVQICLYHIIDYSQGYIHHILLNDLVSNQFHVSMPIISCRHDRKSRRHAQKKTGNYHLPKNQNRDYPRVQSNEHANSFFSL